ncbi:alpha,alpha-trehalose-phosphate synthase [UDP-forming], putative [Phytophthora infestans T30-4]|uniref:Alpha,alpha-trehalose-phosphate synthase [UDP-forming], putative n=1 Tax=Phytophthora infestans (strain T30-4) TaxID=403677 RepID=D0MUA4_PHYIT|nr:alpha,alpha-trehalose-phosphate synthase [UDP-forming], putative [Phytophthora infestans T30-4]EEY61551.1 alpha,alpha-trehalose-phosphate synthase [UDP-forming], putative [Phytophthora infestans T30-4]|eukprot:XP_002908468.1 alpha,alpha-trehalose-phosphate synthase [UDP-forming], putative [Phytophthora infestans T30-4]
MAPPDGWTPETPVIIAANRLPVRLFRTSDGQWHVEWAGDRMIESQNTLSHYEISERATIKFVGRVVDADVPFEERQQVELLLREFNCFPVFLEPQEAKLYYEDYCKQTLWPTFHNVVDVYSPVDVVLDVQAQQHLTPSAQFWNPNWQKVAWQAYANVNQLFAHKICELYEQGDVVWVQDYHLLLTPSYIVRKLRAANVGLFLHVPFPSSEVFRTVSMRKELLRGMLNADHIGFHLFEYARHFMSACRRILGLSYEPILRGQLGIDYGGRRVAVTCSHMAIDVQRIEETLVSKDVRDMVVALRQKYRDKKIFAGCDSIERLKGIPSKMLAFDGFLSRCPDFIGKAVLVQKGIHRRGRVTDYLQSKKEIELAVKAINSKYRDVAKGNVVDYEECVLTDIVNARKKEESFVYMGTGFGLDFRLMEVSAQFRKLTGQELTPAYRTSTNRAIFLDYYRTLAPDVSTLMGVRWPDVPLSALSTLEHLCKDPRNTVFIVSGCNCDLLTQKFGGVPGLGLVAEHGYFIRRAVLGNNARIGRPWERHGDILQSDGGHQQWRVKAEKIVQLYVDRTNGSTLELRRSAVLFRYGKSDFDFGALQAAELKEHLEGVFEGWPLNIIQGKDYIEVRPEGVGKGKLIGHLLNKMRVDGNPTDFVLCIGDDVADELMFEQLKTMTAHEELPQDKVFTCTVGQKPSKAEFFVDDYTDVIALLKSLKVVATKSNRNYSLSDMQSFVRDTRPFLSSSSHGTSGVSRSATSDAVIRKSSSRHALYNHLTPVIEDQINTWLNRLQQLGVVAVLVGILRWRSGVKNPREKKLLMYLVASLGIAWSIQRLRSRPHK